MIIMALRHRPIVSAAAGTPACVAATRVPVLVPGIVPVACVVIVLIVLGCDIQAAIAAVLAMGAAARELTRTA
ncbi:hypothetical protein ACFW1A_26360 [Kitasatospora sp. NPDC058965]|uniref:hypothetical protein n=1 Tax=Kitasatospora sp. NPDC058965 TaxID=3346682 RepID=UPI0036AB6E78